MKKKYNDYCVGCGLCKSEFNCKKLIKEGFTSFDLENCPEDFFNKVCPISGNVLDNYSVNVWGNYYKLYGGWSKDKNLRFKASSGGVITSLAIYLLESKKVDGIIQIKSNGSYNTIPVISTSKKDVIQCMGSRYSNSSVLEVLSSNIDENKKYALIGRPCDISILKNYQNKYKKYNNIIYTISFFCAGNPSDKANVKLLNDMGLKNVKNCISLNYRGNGWPGYATAIDNKKKEYKMRYAESWGNYLGRNIRLMCKFCVDGCGSTANISCGDYWLLDENKKPIFDENDGRNLIFARDKIGDNILNEACKKGYIKLLSFDESKESIKEIQPAQFQRTTTVYSKYLAFKIFFRKTPSYNRKVLKMLSNNTDMKSRYRIFLGTIKRIILKKM